MKAEAVSFLEDFIRKSVGAFLGQKNKDCCMAHLHQNGGSL